MSELSRQSYSKTDTADAVTSRPVMEALRKAAGAALAELGEPLTRAEVTRLAHRMMATLHAELDAGARDA